jgi:hypothetical protein
MIGPLPEERNYLLSGTLLSQNSLQWAVSSWQKNNWQKHQTTKTLFFFYFLFIFLFSCQLETANWILPTGNCELQT